MVFEIRAGSRIKGDAHAIGTELENVRSAYGGLTAPNVVARARKPSNILHQYFEWDDKKAAKGYREDQARHLIASITVKIEQPDGRETPPIRAFVSIGPAEDKYTSISDVLSNPDSRRAMFKQALAELKTFERKYSGLKEFAEIFDLVAKIAA